MAALAVPAPAAADHVYATAVGLGRVGHGPVRTAPSGIDTDRFDNVYVADFGNHRIQKFSPDGELIDAVGSSGSGDGQFRPRSTWRSTAQRRRVRRRPGRPTASRSSSRTAPAAWARNGTTGAGQFDTPSGVATDSAATCTSPTRERPGAEVRLRPEHFQLGLGLRRRPDSSNPRGHRRVAGSTVYVTDYGNDRGAALGHQRIVSSARSTASGGGNPAFNGPDRRVASSADRKGASWSTTTTTASSSSRSGGRLEFKWARPARRRPVRRPRGRRHRHRSNRFFVTRRRTRTGCSGSTGRSTGSVVRTSGTRLVFEADSGAANAVVVSQSGSTTRSRTSAAATGSRPTRSPRGTPAARPNADHLDPRHTAGRNRLTIAFSGRPPCRRTATVHVTRHGGSGRRHARRRGRRRRPHRRRWQRRRGLATSGAGDGRRP